MKAENLMAQSAPASGSAGASLRSAAKAQMASQGAKSGKDDFGSALDDAKNAQKDPRAAEKTDKPDAKKPETADAKPADKQESGPADAVEKAEEAAKELPHARKKDKPAKTDSSAQSADAPEAAGDAATTLSAMLLAMAGNAVPTDAVPTDEQAEPQATGTPQGQPSFSLGVLDSLLPQDTAKEQQAAQNQKLLDMLAGNGAEMRLTDEQMAALSSKAQEAARGEAGLSPQTAEQALQAGAAQARPATQGMETADSLFEGVPLTVEDAILDKVQAVQPDTRQDLGDMAGRQQGQQGETTPEPARPLGGEELGGAQSRQGETQTQPGNNANGAGVLPQGMGFAETLNASAPMEADPVQQAADPYNIMRQVIEQARLIRTDANTEMVIRLHPEHLGELTLRVAVTAGGAINATFHSENAQVRGLLESSMIQLKQELQQQGLKVNHVDVQSGLSEDFFAQSQAGQQGYSQPQHSVRSQAADRRAFEDDADALAVDAQAGTAQAGSAPDAASVGGSDGVDYLV